MRDFTVNAFAGCVASLAAAAAASGAFVDVVASSANTCCAGQSLAVYTLTAGVNADALGRARADLPDSGSLAWLKATPSNGQVRVGGRMGKPAGAASTDARPGQFVLDAGHAFHSLGLGIASIDGTIGAPTQLGSGIFGFGMVPTPGAVALLTLAGFVSQRRGR